MAQLRQFVTASMITVLILGTYQNLSYGGYTTGTVLESPDKQLQITFGLASHSGLTSSPVYSVSYRGETLIKQSPLGISLAPDGLISDGLKITNIESFTSDSTYTLFPGKNSSVRDHYNESVISLEEERVPGRKLDLIFRAYDDGAAFRYSVPEQEALADFTVTGEATGFNIAGNPRAFPLYLDSYQTSYEDHYVPSAADEITPGELIALPLLMHYPNDVSMAITEAHLHDYAGMYLMTTTGTAGQLASRLSPLPDTSSTMVRSTLPHDSPWRVIMVGEEPGALIESNLVSNLNPPNAIGDTSWIKPGKTTFPWWNGFAIGEDSGFKAGLNTETMKHYIDFCAEAGFEYHSLDGIKNVAWYGGPIRPYEGADISTTTLEELDLDEVLDYAGEKNVKLRLWMHWDAARKHMKTAFPIYEKWGIEGIMLDFIDRDDQETVNFITEAVELAAKHHLTVTLHGIYKPTGMTRTYPNLLTYEGVRNLEYNKWKGTPSTPEHELIVPFTRMLAGPLDYHSGGFRHVSPEEFKYQTLAPLVISTRARELARYVVYEGYLPMAADYPAAYRGEAGLDVLVKIPTYWDETQVISGAVGAHITIARRHGDTWYVGSMNGESQRDVNIPLDFLPEGNFTAEIYSDATSADAERKTLNSTTQNVTKSDSISGTLLPAGGHLVIISQK